MDSQHKNPSATAVGQMMTKGTRKNTRIISNNLYLLVALLVFIASAYLDNIRGPLMPAIASALREDNLRASAFLSLGNLGTFCGILSFATLLYKIEIRTAALLGWSFSAIVCFSALYVNEFGIFPLAFGIGLVIATVQSIANLLVLKASPENLRSRNYCALHLMFGVGSFFAPLAASRVAQNFISWQTSIAYAAVIFVIGLFLTVIFFPRASVNEPETKNESFTFNSQKIAALGTFLLYVTGQVLTAQWMMNYLRIGKHFEPALAARYLSIYFIIVTVSRLISYFLVSEEREKLALNISICGSTICLALGHFWPAAIIFAAVQAPFYPIYLGRMSRLFSDSPRRMTLFLLLSAQLGLMLSHSLLAGMIDDVGIEIAYWLPAVAMLLAVIGFNFQEFKWQSGPQTIPQKEFPPSGSFA